MREATSAVALSANSRPQYKLFRVRENEVEQAMGLCYEWLEEALARGHGEYELDDIYQLLKRKEMFMAVGLDLTDNTPICCVVVQLLHFPRKSVLHVVLAGGERPGFAWIPDILADLEDTALLVGASAITGYTFPQLAKFSKRFGYADWYTVVGKELRSENTH